MCEIDEITQDEPFMDGPINSELSNQNTPEELEYSIENPTPTPIQSPDPVIYECPTSEYHPNSDDSYNPTDNNENELGSCDCRSECKYNTGESWKYSNYGYSD